MNLANNTYQKGTIGSNDFKNLVKSGQYVDKSLFIKDVLNDDLYKCPQSQDLEDGESHQI